MRFQNITGVTIDVEFRRELDFSGSQGRRRDTLCATFWLLIFALGVGLGWAGWRLGSRLRN